METQKTKEERLNDLGRKALELIMNCGFDEVLSAEEIREFKQECNEIIAKYQLGEEVWYLENLSILKCNITGVTVNGAGYAFYRLQEATGRTIRGNEWIPEAVIFHTREDLVEAVRKIIGL